MTVFGAIARFSLAALVIFAFAASDASAGAKNGNGKIKFKPGHAAGNGPPPWAPAHGYRRKVGHGHRYMFDGFDLRRVPSFNLAGCNQDIIGMLLGAAAGGYIGSNIGKGSGQLVATGAGVLLGGVLGREFGDSLNHADPACLGRFMETTPDYQTVQWQNPDTGSRYNLMPSETYQDEAGLYCREYQSEATINGEAQRTYGTACRQHDGQWKLVN